MKFINDEDGQQCPNADYTTISAAAADADRGDRIGVCPDLFGAAGNTVQANATM